jgi:hypothetical protein
LEADFRDAYDETDAPAAELTRRRVAVYGVLFEPQQYQFWLAARTDSRLLRDEWTTGRVAERTGGGVFTFTVGGLRADEPAAPAAEALFGGGENSTGLDCRPLNKHIVPIFPAKPVIAIRGNHSNVCA